MQNELKILPRAVPMQRERAPQENIPPTRAERSEVLDKVRRHVASCGLVPPLPFAELRKEAERVCEEQRIDTRYLDYTAVLVNNELWRDTLAAVPFERRLLLLPKCLRVEEHCPAPFDELGLLCKKCGMCSIQDLQDEAEKLGYAVLVAEGSPVVMAIIETGKIDAIVGVSCLSVLERAFPYMEAGAVPGVAIPLLQDDCKDTTVDTDWIWEVIHLNSDDHTRRMDLAGLRDEVDSWFSRDSLAELMGEPSGETERIAHDWLSRAGKRWRPFLTVAMHQALSDEPGAELLPLLKKVAAAVECFHKASLIHDDIEDGDALRYGETTMHEEHGIPVALNAGDYLLGEGYRLLAETDAPADVRARMLKTASLGHRMLTLGQGAELCWARDPGPLKPLEVLEIFRQKTSPAFEVALRLGAILAGAPDDDDVFKVISRYSRSLGLAYQIRDDLEDIAASAEASDLRAQRPTLPLALAYDRARAGDKAILETVWRRKIDAESETGELAKVLERLGAGDRSRELLEAYKEEAIRALWDLDNANVKGLLRRVIGKIFNDTHIKGWCREFEARNASGREVGTEVAG